MLKKHDLIEKIDIIFKNNKKKLSDEDQIFLNEIKLELDNDYNNQVSIDNFYEQIRKIAEIYLGLEDLEKWFPKEKIIKPSQEKISNPPPKQTKK